LHRNAQSGRLGRLGSYPSTSMRGKGKWERKKKRKKDLHMGSICQAIDHTICVKKNNTKKNKILPFSLNQTCDRIIPSLETITQLSCHMMSVNQTQSYISYVSARAGIGQPTRYSH